MLFQHSKKTRCLACLLTISLTLSGCGSLFANNPVVQSIQNGEDRIDLTLDELDPLFDEYEVLPNSPPTEEQDEFQRQKDDFETFIEDVRNAKQIEYQISSTFSGDAPTFLSEVDDFLYSHHFFVNEKNGTTVFSSLDSPDRFFAPFEEDTVYRIQTEEKTSTPLVLENYPFENSIYHLCTAKDIVLLSVDTEMVGEQEYLAYSVTENSNIAKWYFDENNQLFLRIFLYEDIPCMIRYDDLNLNAKVDDAFFSLEGATTLSPLAPVEESSKEESPESSQEESKKPESSKPESSKPESSKPESSKPESSKPVSSKPESSKPASSKPESSKPESSKPVSSKPESSKPPTPSGNNINLNPEMPAEPLPDYSDFNIPPPKPPAAPQLPELYPTSKIPLIPGSVLTSASSDINNGRRSLKVAANLPSTLSSSRGFYESRLSRYQDYELKEMYDEISGYTYIIIECKNVDGWMVHLEIAESHVTSNCTLSIRLDQ